MVASLRRHGVILLAVGAVSALAGCQAVADPTENETVVHLLNDLDVTVGVAPCGDPSCRSLAGSVRNRLAPGGELPVNVSSEGVTTYYRVDRPHAPSRCLRLVVNGKVGQRVITLSSATTCSGVARG